MKVYQFHTLSIYLFTEILNTSDVKLLYRGRGELKVKDLNELNNIWMEIFFRYIDETDDKETKNNLKSMYSILEMEKKYKVVYNALSLYLMPTSSEEKKQLSKVLKDNGQELNHKKELQPQIDKIEIFLKILKGNISQMKLNNKKLFEKKKENVKTNIYKDAFLVGKVLEEKINPRKTVLPEWIVRVKEANEVSKRNKKVA